MTTTTKESKSAGEMTIGGREAFISKGGETVTLLGLMAFWSVSTLQIVHGVLNGILTSFGFVPIVAPTPWQAFVRACKSMNTRGYGKPSWDSSAYVPKAGDYITYDFEQPPRTSLTYLVSRTVKWPRRDGQKPGKRTESLCLIEFTQPVTHQKDGEKVVDTPASFKVVEHHDNVVGPESVQALQAEMAARFATFSSVFTDDDVRKWLLAQFASVQAVTMKSAVRFVPIGHKVKFEIVEGVMAALAPYRTTFGADFGVHHLPVEDAEDRRAWIASEVRAQVSNAFRSLLKQVDSALAEAEDKDNTEATSKCPRCDGAGRFEGASCPVCNGTRKVTPKCKRVTDILDDLEAGAAEIKATMGQYSSLLKRTIELSLDEPSGGGDDDDGGPVITSPARFKAIEEALRDAKQFEDLAKIVGEANVPQVQAAADAVRQVILPDSK